MEKGEHMASGERERYKTLHKEKVERLKQKLLCSGAERHWSSPFFFLFCPEMPMKVPDRVTQLSQKPQPPCTGQLAAALCHLLHPVPGTSPVGKLPFLSWLLACLQLSMIW